MRILVTGSRVFEYSANGFAKVTELNEAMADYLRPLGRWDDEADWASGDTVVIVGDCPTGMDLIAREWATNNMLSFEQFKADWDQHGRAAGPRRNQDMVNSGADVCLAFPLVLHSWSGTMDCMYRADEAGIPVYVGGKQWRSSDAPFADRFISLAT